MKLSVIEWATERLDNTIRIGKMKSGKDRAGWDEDRDYWREIVSRLMRLHSIETNPELSDAPRKRDGGER